MSMSKHWPLAAILPVIAVALLVSGCGKYDALERNMQYVSSDLLQKESVVAYGRLRAAHDAWQASASDETLSAYKEYYAQYAVIYNELMDRTSVGFSSRLGAFSTNMPPAPPGVSATPASPAAAPAPTPASAPPARDLDGSAAPSGASPRPVPTALAPAGVPAPAQIAEAGSYVIRSGDTLRLIAKQLHVSEASLMEANGITNPDILSIGKKLTVPAK
jgi:hypothetical protein